MQLSKDVLGVELPMKSLCGLKGVWFLNLSPVGGGHGLRQKEQCAEDVERPAAAISTPGEASAGMSP